MQIPYGFTIIDVLALVLFGVCWIGHYYLTYVSRWSKFTISAKMTEMREQWMLNIVVRGDSPIDAIIQNGLQQGVLFFASTTVLLLGGLMAGLGSADRGVEVLQMLPLSSTSNPVQWELKILLIMFIFVMAFFKFAWSYRLYNYFLILMGAVPQRDVDDAALAHYAKKLSLLHALAAKHFTTGLNAYFFALAAFTWFLNAWLFMLSTLWVVLVLYRRAYRSEFLRLVKATTH
ncbi:MAG: DUF599 domain-containing protein [Granulosicoccus sp.]